MGAFFGAPVPFKWYQNASGYGTGLEPFLKSGYNFAILQASGNLLNEIDRFYSCVIGMANNNALSFRKIPERS